MTLDSGQRLREVGAISLELVAGVPGSGLLVLDGDLRVIRADGDCTRGHAHQGLVGTLLRDAVPATGWAELEPRYTTALAGEMQSFEYTDENEPTTYAIRLAPVRHDSEIVGVMALTQDITVETAVRDALGHGQDRHRAVLEALDEGVIVTDVDGNLLDANAAACSITGVDLQSAVGNPSWWEPIGARLTGDASALDGLGPGARSIASGGGLRNLPVALVQADGTASSLSVNYLPWRDRDDAVGGLVITLNDVTGSELERRRLATTEGQLREAHELALLASWQWEPTTDAVTVFHSMSGEEPTVESPTSLDDLLVGLTDGQRKVAREQLAGMVSGERDHFAERFRRRSSDTAQWVELRARAIRRADGVLASVRGTTQDVTAQEVAAREIAGARDFFQATLDSLPAHIAVLDGSGTVINTNRAWDEFGLANGSRVTVGGNYFSACDAAAPDEIAASVGTALRAIASGEQESFSVVYPCHSGAEQRWFVLRASRYEGPGDASIVVAHDDVTVRQEAQEKSATQAALLDEVDVAVVASDAKRRVTQWNHAAERLYGWTRAEAVGQDTARLIMPVDSEQADAALSDLFREGHLDADLVMSRKDGSSFPAHLRSRLMLDEAGAPVGMIGVTDDVSERIASERDLRSARDYMRAVADSMGDGLCTLDIEGRIVYANPRAEEMLGWSSAELVGQDLHATVHHTRPDGSPYPAGECPMVEARRTGGAARVDDDFLVVRSGTLLPVQQVQTPFETDDGVGGFVIVFSDTSARKRQEADAQRRLHDLGWIERIRDALDRDGFDLFAQPIVRIADGRTVQHELLIRMMEDDGTAISPGMFLPIAETYGSIGEIDRWVTRQTVSLAAAGHAVEMNVSAQSLSDPTFYDYVESALRRSGADPALLVFELTETALVQDREATEGFARRVRGLGCRLALDDFGTGYGGFTYLKQLPLDFLKIDIEFVRDLVTNPASQMVVQAVVALAVGFGLKTVAEGVEDAVTLEMLSDYGVDYAQGYHVGRPAPVGDTFGDERDEER
jgi:PAS domain S-box-containing protein